MDLVSRDNYFIYLNATHFAFDIGGNYYSGQDLVRINSNETH